MTPQAARFAQAFDVSRETADRLTLYADLLAKWNRAINLVSKATLPALWTRHFADSAQLLSLAGTAPRHWADLGTGGGFPGLVVAILAAEICPRLQVTCVESDRRKAAFLQSVGRETGVDVTVIPERIETLAPLGADVVSARALAPLEVLIGHAARHLGDRGTALFLKGTGYRAEVETALAHWTFRLDTIPSRTDPGSAILKIGSIRRV